MPSRPSRDARRKELAGHALAALAELGFARVNLREIAQRSGLSLGRIHYYFADKTELLILSVDLYKDRFVRRIEAEIDSAGTPAEAIANVADGLALSIVDGAAYHRLWYDVRAQSLFDPAFRPVVQLMEARLIGIFERLFRRMGAVGAAPVSGDPARAYIIIDAWFRNFLAATLRGAAPGAAEMAAIFAAELALASRETPGAQ